MKNLQDKLDTYFGQINIMRHNLPDYFGTCLNRQLRPYQEECMRYFLTYMDPNDKPPFRQCRPELLFHMATGSGKTLIMAACMLWLYEQGYRNFLFFVGNNNILEKTKDNFLNKSSNKYLFAQQILINGKQIDIREVSNFQSADNESLNFCLMSNQGIQSLMNSAKEDALTEDDFSDNPVVFISDEAHHMNSATKKGKTVSGPNLFDDYSDESSQNANDWETTIMRLFNHDNSKLPNIMLEFTATEDFENANIAKKYEDKVIFDYSLSHFREDGYSKEVMSVESDLDILDRAIQAVIVSQYKKKLFASIKLDEKPVIMFKSKTISDNKKNIKKFIERINSLSINDISAIRSRAAEGSVVGMAFKWMDSHKISDENLILELQTDFSEERLLLVDGNNISPEKQRLLNSLESKNNEIRAVFAVDMLNEGWDVLNLFDIVRLYDTRDAKNGKPGKTTNQEAQLIGRGARYLPFKDRNHPDYPVGMRKYDKDSDNPLRAVETLHYHCLSDPRYIQELHTALVKTGIMPDERKTVNVRMKEDFMKTSLYQKGVVFSNERKTLPEMQNDGSIGDEILKYNFKVTMPTGKLRTGLLFSDNEEEAKTMISLPIRLINLGIPVIRTAMNCYSVFHFDKLHKVYPTLLSIKEFIESEKYLKRLNVTIIGNADQIEKYSQRDKLYIAKTVMKQLEPMIVNRSKSYKGTLEFKAKDFRSVFRNSMQLTFAIKNDSKEETGRSMKESYRSDLRADLSKMSWYAYDDCYGSSEEKALVKYIEAVLPKLAKNYDDIYLVRNEEDLKIYDFDTGKPFEPDFLLFMKRKKQENRFDYLQIFIEPKGEGYAAKDMWKQKFLMQIKDRADIRLSLTTGDFNVWGLPFFTENNNEDFKTAFEENIHL